MTAMKDLLRELCLLDGVPGYEDEVREFIHARVSPLADEIIVDALGNLLVFKKGKSPRVRPMVVAAHMDEVGFLVRGYTEDGCIKLTSAGGIDPRVLIGRRMKVGRKKIRGVISLKAIHLTTPDERTKAPPLTSLYVDIGCTSKDAAQKLAPIGEPVMFDSDFIEFGDRCVKAKAIDDRVGCAVAISMLESELLYDTWFAFTTGEEIGTRGASVVGNRLNPGAIMALEGTTAADMPDIPEHKQSTAHRKGAVVSVIDGRTIYSRDLRRKILAEADTLGIKWQYRKSANGGTDAGVLHTAGSGALAFGLATPTRYIHCAMNVLHLPDMEELFKLAMLFNEKVGELDV